MIRFSMKQPQRLHANQLCSPCWCFVMGRGRRGYKNWKCFKFSKKMAIIDTMVTESFSIDGLAYLPANFTICLDTASFTAMTHCTVELCWRNIRKHCLPFARDVCTRPRIHTLWLGDFSRNSDSSDTLVKIRSPWRSCDWINFDAPYLPSE